MSSPWFWIIAAFLIFMPVRLGFACLMYGPKEALEKMGGFWLMFLLAVIVPAAILIGGLELSKKVRYSLPEEPYVDLLLGLAIIGAIVLYAWGMMILSAWIKELIARLRQ